MPRNPKHVAHKASPSDCVQVWYYFFFFSHIIYFFFSTYWFKPVPERNGSRSKIKHHHHRCNLLPYMLWNQKASPCPEFSAITPLVTAESVGVERLPADEPWLEQPPAGETVRLRNNRSMEGSSGLRRLTGQKAEPPWGVKFTLLGSGQDEMRVGLSWCGVLQGERKGGTLSKDF